ncbi:hypothetical protein BJV82DRAFT_713791 [Fennellomyces sp. T-0311]|nr:hypothetical protein BJV82DRAFT_713791 [Fennellomyces sp. T-0311]
MRTTKLTSIFRINKNLEEKKQRIDSIKNDLDEKTKQINKLRKSESEVKSKLEKLPEEFGRQPRQKELAENDEDVKKFQKVVPATKAEITEIGALDQTVNPNLSVLEGHGRGAEGCNGSMILMGGNAKLELVGSLNPFSKRAFFNVMPPTKTWENVSNLSSGVKTLSSLALVFALDHFKTTPLYVMDEIDAALDFWTCRS